MTSIEVEQKPKVQENVLSSAKAFKSHTDLKHDEKQNEKHNENQNGNHNENENGNHNTKSKLNASEILSLDDTKIDCNDYHGCDRKIYPGVDRDIYRYHYTNHESNDFCSKLKTLCCTLFILLFIIGIFALLILIFIS